MIIRGKQVKRGFTAATSLDDYWQIAAAWFIGRRTSFFPKALGGEGCDVCVAAQGFFWVWGKAFGK